MRVAVIAALLAPLSGGCSPPPSVSLPVIARPAVPPIVVRELLLPAGERLAYDVRSNGVPLGRLDVAIDDREVRTSFETSRFVSSLTAVRHRLATTLDRRDARPAAAREVLDRDGEATTIDAAFANGSITVGVEMRRIPGGNNAHTLHTAIGWLRAWADVDARPGFIFVIHLGQLYRLDVATPVFVDNFHGSAALRIDGRAGVYAGSDEPAELTVWLAASPDRTPLRIAMTHGPFEVVADLAQ